MDDFESAYQGVPPWDIGHPQQEFVRLAEEGEIVGRVLDVGCGTGENALYLAGLGHEVWGVDSAPSAIGQAQRKAEERGVSATFSVFDALSLGSLGMEFDTVIDSGLFHVLGDEDLPVYAASVASVLRPGGRYFMLCFGEHQPGSNGPRRVTQAEIRATFGKGWRINYIREAQVEATLGLEGATGWLASITRV